MLMPYLLHGGATPEEPYMFPNPQGDGPVHNSTFSTWFARAQEEHDAPWADTFPLSKCRHIFVMWVRAMDEGRGLGAAAEASLSGIMGNSPRAWDSFYDKLKDTRGFDAAIKLLAAEREALEAE
jgi:hypothetical protein